MRREKQLRNRKSDVQPYMFIVSNVIDTSLSFCYCHIGAGKK